MTGGDREADLVVELGRGRDFAFLLDMESHAGLGQIWVRPPYEGLVAVTIVWLAQARGDPLLSVSPGRLRSGGCPATAGQGPWASAIAPVSILPFLRSLPMTPAGIPAPPDPQTVQADWVSIPVSAASGVPPTTIRAWWSRPAGRSMRGAVLVLPEVFGVNGWVRSVADRLAGQGYGALAITPFSRSGPALDLGYDAAGLAEGREHRDRVEAVAFLADARAAVAWMTLALRQEGLADRPLGCVGFCFGGHLALLAATLPEIGVTCSLYGARISTFRPGGGAPTLALLPQISGRLCCWIGDADPLIPEEEVEAVRQAMTSANGGIDPGQDQARHRLVVVPQVGHGFLCEARDDFSAPAAAVAWRQMLALLDEPFGEP